MRIDSNIDQVIIEVEQFGQEAPAVVRGVMAPNNWIGRARAVAEKELRLRAKQGQEDLIQAFIETVIVELGGEGMASMNWTMDAVLDAAADVVSLVEEMKQGPLFYEAASTRSKMKRAQSVVEEWVAKEKRREFPRDYNADGKALSNRELAQRMFTILFGSRTSGRDAAAEKLAPAIQDFATRQAGPGPNRLTPEQATEWLLAVLESWRQVILAELPTQIADALFDLAQGQSRLF